MTDKQREAIQALADVMDKYDISIGTGNDPVWIEIESSPDIYAEEGIVDVEFLRGELSK